MSEATVTKVRVRRNVYGVAGQPWLVTCNLCGGGGFLAELMGAGVKGWAATWQTAQEYAHHHAVEHEKTRCPTCLHVPEQVPSATKVKR